MGGDGSTRKIFLQLGDGKIAYTDGADFPFVAQFQEGGHGIRDRRFFGFNGRPMDLVKIDPVGGEIAQRAFDLDGDGVGPEGSIEGFAVELGEIRAPRVVPPEAALRGEQNLVATAFNGLGNEALAVAPSIGGSRVEQVDPGVERGLDGADGFGVVVRPAPDGSTADGPGAEADDRC